MFMIVGVVSTILVGKISKEAISGVGLVNSLFGFVMVLFIALSTGGTVLVARLIGENEPENARRAMKQSTVLGGLLSVVVSVICYILAENIINLLFGNAEAQVKSLAVMYLKITLFTYPLALINILISGCLRGAGDTRTPMIIAVIVNILNILLGVVLIFGFDYSFIHIKAYGVFGAALAVAISRGIGGIHSILVLFFKRGKMKIRLEEGFRIDLPILKKIFKVGIPAALEQIVMQSGFLLMQVMISGMGTVALAVFQIGMSINSISFIPGWGFGIAATTLIGQSLGSKKYETAEKCGWETIKISMFIMSALAILIFIFARQLVGIYTNEREVLEIGTKAIRIFSFSQPFLAIVIVVSGGLRGAGDILFVMFTSFVGIWGLRVFVTYTLDAFLGMGIMGVWIAFCADFFIRSIMYMVRFKKGKWKLIKL